MKQKRNYSFLTSRSIAKTSYTIRSSGVLLQTGRVFLMTFIVGVKSYMDVSNETSDIKYIPFSVLNDIEFQVSIPLEIMKKTVLDSFNHFIACMEWTFVLLPGRYTVFYLILSCQISLNLIGWVQFPIAGGTHLLLSKLWTSADGLLEVKTNLQITYNFSWEVTVCGKLVPRQDTCLLICSHP